ncbi:MAG: phosphoadenylyl-sulfate reductase [bacterium]
MTTISVPYHENVEDFTEGELERIEELSGQETLRWAFEQYGKRAAIGTSLQHTGMTQIHLTSQVIDRFRVFTVDTLRLHEETYEFYETVQDRYGIDLEIYQPDPEELQEMMNRHGEYLFFDSREKQQLCCEIRKQNPFDRAVESLDVWICGLRRDQSEERKDTPRAQLSRENGRIVLKLAPLVDWTEEEVWEFIQENDVPYNPLFDEGYQTISCRICTTPVQPGEDKRAGRWRWFNDHNRECGLHLNKDCSGI